SLETSSVRWCHTHWWESLSILSDSLAQGKLHTCREVLRNRLVLARWLRG
ncbi:hypothetical protein LEMLEM_LOCUS11125, partial [Lemmus lemmus]